MSETLTCQNYGTNEHHRTSSPSVPGSAFIYANLPVGPPIHENFDHEAGQNEAQPTMPERSKLRYVIIFSVVLCIAIMGCVSLSLIIVFYSNTGGGGPVYSYSIFCGLFLIIFIFVAAPSLLVLCFQPNSEARSFCSAKCTLYVAVFLAATSMLTGASSGGLLQIFFMTQCDVEIVSMVPIGSIFLVLNLYIASLCIFVAIYSMLMCYRDHSRKSSNLCVGVFIFQILIFNSEVVALIWSSYSLTNVYFTDENRLYVSLWMYVISFAGGVLCVLLLCSCIFGPIFCYLDRNKHRHFNQVGGFYLIMLSICTVGVNIFPAILMFVSTQSLTAYSVPDTTYNSCYGSWHPSAILALSLISGFMYFVGLACVGLFSLCFGCKYLRARRIEENNNIIG